MAVALVVSVVLVCVGVLVDRHWPARPSTSLLNLRLREKVIVTLKSGEAFSGLLWEADDKVWVLRDAVAIGVASKPSVGVDGEVILLADTVAFAQRP